MLFQNAGAFYVLEVVEFQYLVRDDTQELKVNLCRSSSFGQLEPELWIRMNLK